MCVCVCTLDGKCRNLLGWQSSSAFKQKFLKLLFIFFIIKVETLGDKPGIGIYSTSEPWLPLPSHIDPH